MSLQKKLKLKKVAQFMALSCVAAVGVWWLKYATAPAYDGHVGMTKGAAFAPVRGEDVDFHIWYPALAGGRAISVGGNGVFFGTPAGRGAPHKAGAFPMVLISHGAGGNAGQFGWIASALAEAGFVVVLPNHPGTTSRNASAQAAVRVWERPADITAVIDHITSHAQDYPYIDTTRIAALGFSAGGYTAMALSGARVDPKALQEFCDHGDHGMSDCAFLARWGVDLHALDLTPAQQDLTDERVTTSVIIDPGIVETLTPASLAQIDVPMLLVNLGDEGTVPVGVDARGAAELIPNVQYQRLDDATHFSFLAQCKPKGAKILRDEGEADLLCDDAGGRGRGEIHAELKTLIVAYLEQQMGM